MLTTAVPDTHGVDEDQIAAWMSDEEDDEEDVPSDEEPDWEGYI